MSVYVDLELAKKVTQLESQKEGGGENDDPDNLTVRSTNNDIRVGVKSTTDNRYSVYVRLVYDDQDNLRIRFTFGDLDNVRVR